MHKKTILKFILLSLSSGLLLASVQSAKASDVHIGVYLPLPHISQHYRPKHYHHDHYVERYDRHYHDKHHHHHKKHKHSHHHHDSRHDDRHHH